MPVKTYIKSSVHKLFSHYFYPVFLRKDHNGIIMLLVETTLSPSSGTHRWSQDACQTLIETHGQKTPS